MNPHIPLEIGENALIQVVRLEGTLVNNQSEPREGFAESIVWACR